MANIQYRLLVTFAVVIRIARGASLSLADGIVNGTILDEGTTYLLRWRYDGDSIFGILDLSAIKINSKASHLTEQSQNYRLEDRLVLTADTWPWTVALPKDESLRIDDPSDWYFSFKIFYNDDNYNNNNNNNNNGGNGNNNNNNNNDAGDNNNNNNNNGGNNNNNNNNGQVSDVSASSAMGNTFQIRALSNPPQTTDTATQTSLLSSTTAIITRHANTISSSATYSSGVLSDEPDTTDSGGQPDAKSTPPTAEESGHSSKLSTPALIGIVVAAISGASIVVTLAGFVIYYRRRVTRDRAPAAMRQVDKVDDGAEARFGKPELDARGTERGCYELNGSRSIRELDSRSTERRHRQCKVTRTGSIRELDASSRPTELSTAARAELEGDNPG
ncbi:hypothetical protein F4808DRAFT_370844 [Astrocystis sublimbata]|nr:hypothetical protein F4808DRAFT_370844 [Astrocystis sublimbata]